MLLKYAGVNAINSLKLKSRTDDVIKLMTFLLSHNPWSKILRGAFRKQLKAKEIDYREHDPFLP